MPEPNALHVEYRASRGSDQLLDAMPEPVFIEQPTVAPAPVAVLPAVAAEIVRQPRAAPAVPAVLTGAVEVRTPGRLATLQPAARPEPALEVVRPRGQPQTGEASESEPAFEVRRGGRDEPRGTWHGPWQPQVLEADRAGSVVDVTPAADPILALTARLATQLMQVPAAERRQYLDALSKACEAEA
jgi:hypothetical protein